MPLTVKLTIVKNDPDAKTEEETVESMSKSMNFMDLFDGEDDDEMYKMEVKSKGKYSRKADWEDLEAFTGKAMGSDTLAEWIDNYQQANTPEHMGKPNRRPIQCYIFDVPRKGFTVFKDYDWNPVKLNLKPGMVDVKENCTKQVLLEEFQLDYSTDLEKILLGQGDKQVTSTLKKSKLGGHPLALAMMTTKSEISTEFCGIESTAFALGGKNEPSETDEETGDQIWKDVKSLRALLKDKPMPKKTGAGVTRTVKVVALESFLKARVYYKASFTGEVSTDHKEKFDGQRYWNFPLKYLFRDNGVTNAAIIYEDIELRFYTDVKVAMDNKYFEWQKDNEGKWMKSYNNIG
jgi:hypothetical protein